MCEKCERLNAGTAKMVDSLEEALRKTTDSWDKIEGDPVVALYNVMVGLFATIVTSRDVPVDMWGVLAHSVVLDARKALKNDHYSIHEFTVKVTH